MNLPVAQINVSSSDGRLLASSARFSQRESGGGRSPEKPSWWAFICGMTLPLEAVVVPGIPVRISLSLAVPAAAGAILAISGRGRFDPDSRRIFEAFFAMLFGMVGLGYAAALSAPMDWTSADISRGWLRAPTHVAQFGLFFAAATGLAVLAQDPRWRRALLRGFCWVVFAASVYALADFSSRFFFAVPLPQIGNDPVTADRRLASFVLSGNVMPRVSGSAGEPKGFAWILLVYLIVWIGLRRDVPSRLARLPGAVLPLAALLVTFSTSGWVMALTVLPLAAWAKLDPVLRRQRFRALCALVGFLLVAASALVLLREPSRPAENALISIVEERLGPKQFNRPLTNIEMASSFILERPLGWGLGNYHLPVERDTGVSALGYAFPGILLYIAVEAGVAGLLLVLAAFGALARFIWLHMRSDRRVPYIHFGSLIVLAWLMRSTEVGGFDPLLALGLALILAPTSAPKNGDKPPGMQASDRQLAGSVSGVVRCAF